jgi:UDPglucose--hexose-1-phosphate uridylyltransferase
MQNPHRRLNLLTGDWVLVSPHRSSRPWMGAVEKPPSVHRPSHDPGCHLCPGNLRFGGTRNPDYSGPYVFANDFPPLTGDTVDPRHDNLLVSAPARGEARVLCFSPDHSLTIPQLSQPAVKAVVACWCAQSDALGQSWAHVEIFENKGEMMGCSNPHPHGQIWASDFIPTAVANEDSRQRRWLSQHGEVMLDAVVEREIAAGDRVVEINAHWLAIVPWWAAWPFEVLLIARGSATRLEDLAEDEREALAEIFRRITARYDNLFETSFPYSMGWHGAPHGQADTEHWRLHAHFYPPLLRSASVRKFMVGFEMLGEAQRDLTPEQAAERLRAVRPEL